MVASAASDARRFASARKSSCLVSKIFDDRWDRDAGAAGLVEGADWPRTARDAPLVVGSRSAPSPPDLQGLCSIAAIPRSPRRHVNQTAT